MIKFLELLEEYGCGLKEIEEVGDFKKSRKILEGMDLLQTITTLLRSEFVVNPANLKLFKKRFGLEDILGEKHDILLRNSDLEIMYESGLYYLELNFNSMSDEEMEKQIKHLKENPEIYGYNESELALKNKFTPIDQYRKLFEQLYEDYFNKIYQDVNREGVEDFKRKMQLRLKGEVFNNKEWNKWSATNKK